VQFYIRINQLLEDISTDVPPAMVQHVVDTKLTFEDILSVIKKHEGYRREVYLDTRGIPTIGIGFNLLRSDARSILKSVGADHAKIMAGAPLSDEQIKQIFQICMQIAYADAKKWIPSFDGLPRNVKLAIIDMSFNLGYTRLNKFEKTKAFILRGDFKSAAHEIKKSKWATQVGNRVHSVVNLFSS